MSRTLLLSLVALAAASPASAQGSLSGVWKVTYPAGARVDNGEQSVIMGTGTIRIEAHGDSLLGEFVPDPVPDLPAPKPIRMTGPAGKGPVALVSHQMAMVEVNGAQQPVYFVSTWQLEAKGDSLLGTLSHQVEDVGVTAQDPGPVRGVRKGT